MVNSEAAKTAGRPPAEIEPAFKQTTKDEPSQVRVYRAYLRIQSLAEGHPGGSLAGKLVLSAGFGHKGTELAIASTIAAAAFLGIENDPRRLKAAVRNGSCNFMVNTLDEALRVLKNEIRKRQPVSVGLLGSAGDLISAMLERGVQPDLLCDTTSRPAPEDDTLPPPSPHWQALLRLADRGAVIFDPTNTPQPADSLEMVWTAATPQDMRRMDRLAVETLPAEDTLHRLWLQGAAAFFHRQKPLERVVGLDQPHLQQVLDAFTRSNIAAAFASPASIYWQNRDGSTEKVAW